MATKIDYARLVDCVEEAKRRWYEQLADETHKLATADQRRWIVDTVQELYEGGYERPTDG